MKKDEVNRINTLLKTIDNTAILLEELFMPIDSLMQKHNCTRQEACNIKIKAEEFLTKFGTFSLNSTSKTIKTIINKQ